MPFDGLSQRPRLSGSAKDPGFAALKALIIARTGHHYYADKDELLFDRLRKRFKVRSLKDCSAYSALLAGPGGTEEWTALEAEITIGETFFFRYAEQFAALRDVILPALIAARASERQLRLWSAGCASGAEPHSVAILLHDLLGPSLAEWDLSIVGTDISEAALAVARKAEYGRWALRTLLPEERLRWFRHVPASPGETGQARYALRAEYRRMVRFERQNLLDLLYGGIPVAFREFDLILCRNVLIYFSPQHVDGIIRALGNRLGPHGWLLIGHAEPKPDFETWLKPVSLPGTVAYRRLDGPALPPARASAEPWQPILPEARPAPAVSDLLPPPESSAGVPPADAPIPLPRHEPSEREDIPDGGDLARIKAFADAGESAKAWRLLRDALGARPADPLLLHYQGLLARSLGREAEAERAFRGALFVDKDFVMAHVQLGLLLAGSKQPVQAKRALVNALRLIQAMPPDSIIPESDGASATDMIATLQHACASLRDPDA